jgi:eukaryotic-like serine/threonine-protein kinase
MTPERWRRIEDIYHAAQGREPGERGAFVSEACGGDAELKRQIEAMLAQDSDGAILDRPADELVPESSVSPSTRLGPYQIVSSIGRGGMGEVWKARDSRLNRDVAIKISARQFTGRFEREARAIAALNHANICTLYDIGPNYLVMELVEGQALSGHMKRGPIPLEEALGIAKQIADALESAHEKGIVHRDLKPGNIMIRPNGSVKVLDFGLARSRTEESATAPETQTTTAPGTIMGTPRYMAPEQARGEKVDKRADIWAFGVILYEMVAGGRLFEGETTSDTLAAVLKDQPEWTKIPARLQRLLRMCLEKDPNRRLRDISGVDLLLDAEPTVAAAAPVRSRFRTAGWMAVAVGCLVAAIVAGSLLLTPRRHGVENYRYTPMEISQENVGRAVWSPDGKAFAYSAVVDGKRQTFVRYLNISAPAQITHEPGGTSPLGWSPDNLRVIVMGNNTRGGTPPLALFSLSVAGGEPEFVMPLDARIGVAMPLDTLIGRGVVSAGISPDGKVLTVVQRRAAGEVLSVATSSPVGSPLKRYSPAPFETAHFSDSPRIGMSPDGSRILYVLTSSRERAWSLPFPAERAVPKQIFQDLSDYPASPEFSWFPDSRHIAIVLRQRLGEPNHLWIADTASSDRTPLTTGSLNDSAPAVSPNGKQVLLVESAPVYKLVSASLKDASARAVISSQRPLGLAAWARQSDRFAYVTGRNGVEDIWLREPDGSDRPLVKDSMFPAGKANRWGNTSLSPNGERIAYTHQSVAGDVSIWISSLSGGPPVRLTNSDTDVEMVSSWSPDGGRMAYSRVKNGIRSVMICRTSGQATPVELIPLNAGTTQGLPDWSPTGEWITFQDASGWHIISPDGKSTRSLGMIDTQHLVFSKDGKSLYGIRPEGAHQYLFSLDVSSNRMKTIGDVGSDFAPGTFLNNSLRFSLAPDGQSILYSSVSNRNSLWMLEGFDAPP